jgi:iron complex outermembrane recepter protein
MTLRTAIIAGVSLIPLLSPAARAAAADDKNTTVTEVVVTAQRRSENIQDVPISIQAFKSEDLRSLGVKSSIDLGQITPNVDIALVAGPGNQPIITIRGIGLNDYDTNNAGPNGVYVDEVYLSAPGSQSFSTFDLDHVEVLKGPQGTLYGRNTSGGAINFITKKPTDHPEGFLHVEYSSFNTVNLEGAVSGPLTSTLSGRISFVYNYSQGYFHNDLTNSPENGANNYAVRAQLRWKPNSQFNALLNLHGGQVDNHVTEYRHIGAFAPGTQGSASPVICSVAQAYAGGCVDLFGYGTPSDFYHGSFNRPDNLKVNNLGASLRMEYALGSVTLTSLTGFEHNDKLHPEDSDASPNRLLEINFGVRSNTFTQEFRASQTTARYNWVLGAYYLHEDLKQNQPLYLFLDFDQFGGFGVPPGPGAGDGIATRAFDRSDQITNAYAVFGQGTYEIVKNLKLTLGGRYSAERRGFDYEGSQQLQSGGMDNWGPLQTIANSYQELSNDALTGRAALDYHLHRDILIYGSVANGFKSGGFNGSFLSTDPSQVLRQLAPIKPEHVLAYELGFKSSFFDRRLQVDAAAFYNKYNDLQVFVLVPTENLPVNVLDNARSAHTEGIELQIAARPTTALTLSTQMGWLKTRLDSFVAAVDPTQPDYTGRQLPISPHFSMAAAADYRIPIGAGEADLQFSVTHKSHQFFDISNDPYTTQDGYWLENLRLSYKPNGGHWEMAGYIHNLSDRKYLLDAFDLINPFGFIQGIVGTPRSFGLEINYNY